MFIASSSSDPGRVRDHNEDSVLIQDFSSSNGILFAGVADGVGGEKGGEVASQMALQLLAAEVERSSDLQSLRSALPGVIQQINASICKEGRNRGLEGMGCTLTFVAISGDAVVAGNVGDSRTYLLRKSGLRQITRDHSLIAEAVRAGVLSPEEASRSTRQNIITRMIGMKESVEVDVFDEKAEPGDVILLCSDGLHKHLPDSMIAQVASGLSPDETVRQLIDLANSAGGTDNVSVVVVRIDEIVPVGQFGGHAKIVSSLSSAQSARTGLFLSAGVTVFHLFIFLLLLACFLFMLRGYLL